MEQSIIPSPSRWGILFSISGSKTISLDHIQANIGVTINNEHIGKALSSSKTTYGGFSYQFTRKLKAKDKVEVFIQFGKTYLIYFTGFMLEEDLAK